MASIERNWLIAGTWPIFDNYRRSDSPSQYLTVLKDHETELMKNIFNNVIICTINCVTIFNNTVADLRISAQVAQDSIQGANALKTWGTWLSTIVIDIIGRSILVGAFTASLTLALNILWFSLNTALTLLAIPFQIALRFKWNLLAAILITGLCIAVTLLTANPLSLGLMAAGAICLLALAIKGISSLLHPTSTFNKTGADSDKPLPPSKDDDPDIVALQDRLELIKDIDATRAVAEAERSRERPRATHASPRAGAGAGDSAINSSDDSGDDSADDSDNDVFVDVIPYDFPLAAEGAPVVEKQQWQQVVG